MGQSKIMEYIETFKKFALSCYETLLLNIIHIFEVLVVILAVYIAGKSFIYVANYFNYRRIRTRKLEQTQSTKQKLLIKLSDCKKPHGYNDQITALPYDQIRQQLYDSTLKVIDLLEAYQAKALEVDGNLNCITDVMYDADERAFYLDSLYPKKKRGLLHGIPLSIKENIKQAGFDSYYGCVSRCFNPEEETACVIQALEKEGMIPFVRTTMSQGGMSISCGSPLFGETLNPHDNKRTSGGSSGGEGALIAGRGSIAGLGTDCGGSVRVPASYCGIYALKPTSDRMGCKSLSKYNNRYAMVFYQGQVGPMSSDFDLLVDMMRVLFSQTLFDLDDTIPRLPFNHEAYNSKQPMRIGFFKSFTDKYLSFDAVPAVERAIELAKTALERRGHTLVEWEPPRVGYACDLLVRCLFPDKEHLKQIYEEEFFLTPSLQWLTWFARAKPITKSLMSVYNQCRDPVISRVMSAACESKSPNDILALILKANSYKDEFMVAWNQDHLDGLICPVLPFAALLVGDTQNRLCEMSYCSLFNFLNYPAGVVPVCRVNENDIVQLKETYPREQAHQRLIIKSQSDSVGMPVGVQCISKKWQDEKALRLMREVKLGLQMVAS